MKNISERHEDRYVRKTQQDRVRPTACREKRKGWIDGEADRSPVVAGDANTLLSGTERTRRQQEAIEDSDDLNNAVNHLD